MRFALLLVTASLFASQAVPAYGDMRKQYQNQLDYEEDAYQRCANAYNNADFIWQSEGVSAYVVKNGDVTHMLYYPEQRYCYWSDGVSSSSKLTSPKIIGKIGKIWGNSQYQIEQGDLILYSKTSNGKILRRGLPRYGNYRLIRRN